MILVTDAVGVGKMGMLQSQFLHLRVHGLHAAGNGAAAEIFRQQVGTVVGAGHHGGIQSIRQGDFLPFLQSDMAGIGPRQRVNVLMADRQLDVIPLALRLFTGKPQRHHLGDGGRVEFFVHILLFQHQTAVGIDDAVLFICTPAALLKCRPGLPQAVHSKDIRAVSADSTRSDTLSVLKMQTAV